MTRRSSASNVYFGMFIQWWALKQGIRCGLAAQSSILRKDMPFASMRSFRHAIVHRSPKMTEKTPHGALLSAVSQYLEMMYDGDLSRFDAVFAPTAQLHGVQEGQVRACCRPPSIVGCFPRVHRPSRRMRRVSR